MNGRVLDTRQRYRFGLSPGQGTRRTDRMKRILELLVWRVVHARPLAGNGRTARIGSVGNADDEIDRSGRLFRLVRTASYGLPTSGRVSQPAVTGRLADYCNVSGRPLATETRMLLKKKKSDRRVGNRPVSCGPSDACLKTDRLLTENPYGFYRGHLTLRSPT